MSKPLPIDLRDTRLPTGRLAISSGTRDPLVRDRRLAALRALLDRGERGLAILERLRTRRISIEDVQTAVERMDLGTLEPSAEEMADAAGPVRHTVFLGATIDRWLMQVEGRHAAAGTLTAYRGACRGLEAAFGVERDEDGRIVRDVDVAAVGSAEAEVWLHGKKGKPPEPGQPDHRKPWAARTQTRNHTVAAGIWDVGVVEDEELAKKLGTSRTLEMNPWRKRGERKGIRPAKVKKTRFEFLRRHEAARLLRAARGTPQAAWIAAGIYQGVRIGEAGHLRLGVDVDLERGQLHIQARGGAHPWRPKTENSTRDVPLHPRLARWVRRHIEAGYAGEVYLFRIPGRDEPLKKDTRERWTAIAYKDAGIRYGRKKDALTHHSLRHTFASWLTQADVHPLKIAQLMGDTVEEVMETYAHLVSKDLVGALRKL